MDDIFSEVNEDLFELFSNLLQNEEEAEILKVIMHHKNEEAVYNYYLDFFRTTKND